jgi:large subunit ribosomal protein L32
MPVPKQRHNTSRRNRRRKHNDRKATVAQTQKCAACGAEKLPHHVCDACGVYRGVQYKEIVKKVGA